MISFGKFQTNNEFFMAPVKTAMATPGEGVLTTDQIEYYTTRARGGVGTIILEPIAVLKSGKEHPKQLMMTTLQHQDQLKRLVELLHSHNTKVIVHLNHAGRGANPTVTGEAPVSASAVSCPASGAQARALSKSEIVEIIAAFSQHAVAAEKLGVDGIEIQFGHGYLVSQFQSAGINQREDEYGQDRLLFARQLLESIQADTSLPIFLRISGSDFTANGVTDEDIKNLLLYAETRKVSAIHVGWGNVCETPPWYYNHMSLPTNVMDQKLRMIRSWTSLPMIAAGRMQSQNRFHSLLSDNTIQGVALGRQLIIDPDYPSKILQQQKDIIRCGGCLQGCLSNVKKRLPIGCIANPRVASKNILPPIKKKNVAIVGGGVAGMFAGLFLKERGANVTLYEKETELGGQWHHIYRSPGKNMMKDTLEDIIALTEKSINVHKEREIEAGFIKEQKFDSVLIATGAEAIIPNIPGLSSFYTGFDLYLQPSLPGISYVVIGGGLIGMEAAEHLVQLGKKVTVVELLEETGKGMEAISQKLLMKELQGRASILTKTRVNRIVNQEVFINSDSGETSLGYFDGIVLAVGTKSVSSLYSQLKGILPDVYLLGDARSPGQVMEATRDALEIVSNIE